MGLLPKKGGSPSWGSSGIQKRQVFKPVFLYPIILQIADVSITALQ
jgi:hypothetical protein